MDKRVNYFIALSIAIIFMFSAYFYLAETFMGFIMVLSPAISFFITAFLILSCFQEKKRRYQHE